MTATRNYVQKSVFHAIDKAISLINAATPKAAVVLFQRLRLSNSFVESVSLYILNQRIYLFQRTTLRTC